jgi:hypothetical protein
MLADYINQSDTAAMLDPYLLAADTNSLSDRIDEKLNISDTASMLADYINQYGHRSYAGSILVGSGYRLYKRPHR